jgi:hypothetical protein
MTGKNKAHSMTRCEMDDPGIMRKQNGGRIARNSTHRTPHISAVAIIVHTGNIEGGATELYRNMLIPKNFYMLPLQRRGNRIGPYPEIVVSQDGQNAVARSQAAQDFRGRLDIRARVGNEVSSKHNDIRTESIGLLYRFSEPLLRQK